MTAARLSPTYYTILPLPHYHYYYTTLGGAIIIKPPPDKVKGETLVDHHHPDQVKAH
jgi:hypothetical protein